jgi:hypothetical protein
LIPSIVILIFFLSFFYCADFVWQWHQLVSTYFGTPMRTWDSFNHCCSRTLMCGGVWLPISFLPWHFKYPELPRNNNPDQAPGFTGLYGNHLPLSTLMLGPGTSCLNISPAALNLQPHPSLPIQALQLFIPRCLKALNQGLLKGFPLHLVRYGARQQGLLARTRPEERPGHHSTSHLRHCGKLRHESRLDHYRQHALDCEVYHQIGTQSSALVSIPRHHCIFSNQVINKSTYELDYPMLHLDAKQ